MYNSIPPAQRDRHWLPLFALLVVAFLVAVFSAYADHSPVDALLKFGTLLVPVWATVKTAEWADNNMSPSVKESVSAWIQAPVAGVERWTAVFLGQFDRIFDVTWSIGRRVPTPSFRRSALASAGSAILVFLYWTTQFDAGLGDVELAYTWQLTIPPKLIPLRIEFPPPQSIGGHNWWLELAPLLLGVLINWFPDYLSLIQTRLVLKQVSTESRRVTQCAWIAVDFLATLFVVLATLAIAALFSWAAGVGRAYGIISLTDYAILGCGYLVHALSLLYPSVLEADILRSWIRYFGWGGQHFLEPNAALNFYGVFIYSTFLTSFSLWAFLAASMLIRSLLFVDQSRALVRRLIDVDNRPMASLAVMFGMLYTGFVFVGLVT